MTLSLLCVVIVLDMTMYSSLAPILPELKRVHGLSNAMAGLVVAAYPLGLMIFAVPAGLLVGRTGGKRAVILGVVILAVSSVGFGVATSPELLLLTRVVQGMSAALSWAGTLTWIVGRAPRHRQGLMLGTVLGMAGAGAVAGPGLGMLATFWNKTVVFTAFGLVALAVAMALAREVDAEVSGGQRVRPLAKLLLRGRGAVFTGVLLLCAGALGGLGVMIPLRLDHLATPSALIGATFLGVALLEIAIGPLVGRWVDRSGPDVPLIFLLLAATSVVLLYKSDSALITVAVVAVCLPPIGLLYTPAISALTDLIRTHGLAMAGLFGLSNFIFAVGEGIGALSAGWLVEADLSDRSTLALALLCVGATSLVAWAAPGARGRSASRPTRD